MKIRTPFRAAISALPLLLFAPDADAARVARVDRAVMLEGSAAMPIDVLQNDGWSVPELSAGQLSLVGLPQKGTATIEARGRSGALDDRVIYTPFADAIGRDSFRYRICAPGAPNCSEARVDVVLRPHADIQVNTASHGGYLDLEFEGLRAMPSPRFPTTRLVSPVRNDFPLDVDPTPDSPWDSPQGTLTVSTSVHPGNPAPTSERPGWVLVDVRSLQGKPVDLYVGVDRNRNGVAEASELECTAATPGASQRCEISVDLREAPLDVWVRAHNRDGSTNLVRTEVFNVGWFDGDSASYNYGFSVTGPGNTPDATPFPVRASWFVPWLRGGESLGGFLMVKSAPGQPLRPVPVRIDRAAQEQVSALPLMRTWFEERRMLAGETFEGLFFDVPEGAAAVRLATNTLRVELQLTRVDDDTSPAPSRIPAPGQFDLSLTPGFDVEVPTSTLSPGRWYLRAINRNTTPTHVVFGLDFVGGDRTIKPGSYYNPERSGHGLFLYPAGDTWAGLWYTYLQDGSPTWYYLQRSAVSTHEGAFAMNLYRAAWDGSTNHLVRFGEAMVTVGEADGIVFSYQLDGEVGSERLQALGSGCPQLDGAALDASSHWFNPAKAGTGYSVQLFPAYEFYAAFVYDALGQPRFLTSESPAFQGAEATLALEQLSGFCPLCERTGAPTRTDIGTLTRRFDASGLVRMELEGVYFGGVPGAWTGDEPVQTLGGPGTTQGCQTP